MGVCDLHIFQSTFLFSQNLTVEGGGSFMAKYDQFVEFGSSDNNKAYV